MNDAEAQALALSHSLECIVTLPTGLGLTTATPLQRAICRVATGEPLGELAEHPHVIEAIGRPDLLWGEQPDEVIVLSPSRTGKSTMAAGMAIRATQTVDLSLATTAGEPPVIPILSLDKPKARAVYGVVEQALKGPFQHLCVTPPRGSRDGGNAMVRHPSGAVVEIAVVAGKADGAAVISRWLIGLIIDEAARMQGSERVINLPQTLSSARDRLLPGAQIAMISSKWAPYGPVYEACQEHGGRPNRAKSIVVIGSLGCEAAKLNPAYYTPARLKKLRDKDESAYLVAENRWQSPGENMFDLAYLQSLARPRPTCDCDARQRSGMGSPEKPACPHGDSPPHPRQKYLAIIDPATRGNAWTLVLLTVRELADTDNESAVATRCLKVRPTIADSRPDPTDVNKTSGRCTVGYRDDVALCRQWQGSSAAPLDPDAIFKEIAELLRPYRCNRVSTDKWSADANRTIALQHGLYLAIVDTTMRDSVDAYDGIATALAMTERGHTDKRSLELHPCPALHADLSRVTREPVLNGVRVRLPITSDGRHCDYAAALALGHAQVLQRPDAASVHEPADQRRDREERERMAAAQERRPEDTEGVSYEGCDYGE
jgi:hypothetical protein